MRPEKSAVEPGPHEPVVCCRCLQWHLPHRVRKVSCEGKVCEDCLEWEKQVAPVVKRVV
jgi:hypothetical protein